MSIITLPLPPTDNQLRVPARGILIKSSYCRMWETLSDMHENVYPKELHRPTYEQQMRFCIELRLENKRRDISNFTKAIKDYLTDKLWVSDKWVDLEIQLPVIVIPGQKEQVIIHTTPTIYRPLIT